MEIARINWNVFADNEILGLQKPAFSIRNFLFLEERTLYTETQKYQTSALGNRATTKKKKKKKVLG